MKHIVLILISGLFSLCSIARDPATLEAEKTGPLVRKESKLMVCLPAVAMWI